MNFKRFVRAGAILVALAASSIAQAQVANVRAPTARDANAWFNNNITRVLTLPGSDAGSRGEIGGMTATPSNSDYFPAGSLSRFLYSPTFLGPIAQADKGFILGGGAFRVVNSAPSGGVSQWFLMRAPGDTGQYVDNVLSIQNLASQPDGTNTHRGNAAINFLDHLGQERGACGYSHIWQGGASTGFFTNTLYCEGGNLTKDNENTHLAWVLTYKAGSSRFKDNKDYQYQIIRADGTTGHIQFSSSNGLYSHDFDPENHISNFYGPSNHLSITGTATGVPVSIRAYGNDPSVALRFDDQAGGGVQLASAGYLGLAVSNPTSAPTQNYVAISGGVAGNPVRIAAAGGDQDRGMNLVTAGLGRLAYNGTPFGSVFSYDVGTSGATVPLQSTSNFFGPLQQFANGINVTAGTVSAPAYTVGGQAGASCVGAPTANFRVVYGIVTAC